MEFEVEEFVQVDDSKPGMVKVFDYYQPGRFLFPV